MYVHNYSLPLSYLLRTSSGKLLHLSSLLSKLNKEIAKTWDFFPCCSKRKINPCRSNASPLFLSPFFFFYLTKESFALELLRPLQFPPIFLALTDIFWVDQKTSWTLDTLLYFFWHIIFLPFSIWRIHFFIYFNLIFPCFLVCRIILINLWPWN